MALGVLVIEDEAALARNIERYLGRLGYDARVAATAREGREAFDRFHPDLVVLDFRLPDADGLDLLDDLRQLDPSVRVIMMSGAGSVEVAVEAMKRGAYHYIQKPVVLGELRLLVEKATGQDRMEGALSYYRRRDADSAGLDRLVGESRAMVVLRETVRQLAQSEARLRDGPPPSVLVIGETGTGKELVARALHFEGPRHEKPFVAVNCAALPANLLESELFGHERGAFTDARTRKTGLAEAADGGTLFLDEIGDTEPAVQTKLLRLLESRTVRRLGGLRDIPVDVRIVAATNQPLEQMVAEGRFRSDLYYRLRVVEVPVPPLRERGDDALRLAHHFLAGESRRYGKPELRLGPDAEAAIGTHRWPGNVRELRNAIEHTVLLAAGPEIRAADLGLARGGAVAVAAPVEAVLDVQTVRVPAQGIDLDALERRLLADALDQTRGNVTRAARLLSLSRDTLRYRLEKHGLRGGDGGDAGREP
ncbi:MAG: sigma-54-dependent Fis family transcriptional regulator [Ectothiorhodospiraceae bacterium]|nr:sigma-54-dependent Fis family transcriptional regulator [Chromatiales bacterium]MCP5153689.1 sigma-54-dependent Fis family transcriptional regulator [Ectothiorhodospiraceae bacterium]